MLHATGTVPLDVSWCIAIE